MYLRETKRRNRDGSTVSYLQLAHSERHPVTGVADDQCDIGRFQTKRAAATDGRFEQASRYFASVLDEWKGPVLADLRDFQFVEPFATALVEEKLLAHTARAEAEIACGRAHAVIGELEALTAEHPYREPLWAELITALYVTDRQTDALAACRRLRKVLGDEFGLEPGARIQDLEARILRHEPLQVKHAARNAAIDTLISQSSAGSSGPATAYLRDTTTGARHPVKSGLTTIGRIRTSGIDIAVPDVQVG